MKKIITIMVLLLSLVLVACTPSEEEQPNVPDVESIQFQMDSTTLTPGEHTLVAVALPEGSNQQIRFTVQGIVSGVSITDDKLNIGNAVEDGTTFTVVATSVYDPTIRQTIVFTVENVGVEAVEITTEAQLRAINTAEGGLAGSYILMNHIELTAPWTPIGVAEVELDTGDIIAGDPFTGIFDGNGFTISGIDISSEEPLFNGGFFAQIGPTAIVRNTAFEGVVNATGWSGGIAGINEGLIENVVSNMVVTVAGTSAGSIVSVNRGLIQYAYGIGKVVSETNPNTSGRSAGLVVANDGSMVEVYGDYQTLETPNYAAFVPTTNPNYMLPTVDMKSASTWSAFDQDRWYIADGTYPLLKHDGFEPPVIVLERAVAIRNTVLEVDVEVSETLQINAEVVNPSGGEVLEYALKAPVAGVSIDASGLVTFDPELVASSFSFTVVVTIEGTEITAERAFTGVYNPEIVDDTVYISTAAQLLNLLSGQMNPENLSKTFVLTNDIVLETPWTAIGLAPNEDDGIVGVPFTGIFDGQGYTISGIDMPGGGWTKAFFGFIGADAVVKNTHFEGYVEANAWSGAIAAHNAGTIQDVVVEMVVYVYGANGGAIVVHNHGLLKNIVVLGRVASDSGPTAVGLVATNFGTLENVFANADTVGTANLASFGTVVDDGSYIISAQNFILAATYAAFDTDIWYVTDGIAPMLKYEGFVPPVIVPELGISIDNTIVALDLEIDESLQVDTTILNPLGEELLVYALKDAVNGVSIDQTGLVTFDLELVSASFSFTVVVSIEGTEVSTEKTFSAVYNPEIVDDTVYISNETELVNLLSGQTNPENLSKTFVLTSDIVLTSPWVAIGIAPNEDEGIAGVAFTGIFDGQGYKISGINMPNGGWTKAFFGFVGADGVVKNTHFEGYVEGNAWSAGLVAHNAGTIQDVIVEIDVYVYGGNGGAIAVHNHGILQNIVVLGSVASDSGANGLVATNFGTVVEVYANADTVGTPNFKSLGAVLDDGTYIISNASFLAAATYAAFDDAIWLIVEGMVPVLINESSEEPVLGDTVYISNETELLTYLSGQVDPEMLSKTYMLTANIELTQNWVAIGIAPNEDEGIAGVAFTGIFDGQGFMISGINMPNGGWTKAFFGFVGADGVVKNTHFEGYVEANAWSAGLVAHNAGTIQDVVVDIEVYVYGANGAALVLHNHGVLQNIIVLGKAVSDNGPTAVGLLATNFGTVVDVYANIDTIGTTNFRSFGAVLDDGTYFISPAAFVSAATYASFDTQIWTISEGFVPTLKVQIALV